MVLRGNQGGGSQSPDAKGKVRGRAAAGGDGKIGRQ